VFKGLLTQDRTDFDGKYYQLTARAPGAKPAALPLLIGGAGGEGPLGIIARYGRRVEPLGPAETAVQKGECSRHCEKVGRDPGTVRPVHPGLIESSCR